MTLQRIHDSKPTPTLVLIGGLSRSGKSTIARGLMDCLTQLGMKTYTLSLDDWIHPVSIRAERTVVLQRYDVQRFLSDYVQFLSGRVINIHPYNPVTREKSVTEKALEPPRGKYVLIIEGVIALAIPELSGQSSVKLFVKSNNFVRFKRLIKLYRDDKGLSKSDYKTLISSREGEEVSFIKKTQDVADYII